MMDRAYTIERIARVLNDRRAPFIRKSMMGKRSIKLPSTSEMLDWLRSLDRYTLDAEGEREMKKVENILKKDSREVVFPETLFKTKEDYFAGSQFIQ